MDHEIWFTSFLNKFLGGWVALLLGKLGYHADPAHSIPNYVAMEILVILVLIVGAIFLRKRLSMENPSSVQHMMEVVVEFTQNMNDDIIGHSGRRYVAMVGTLGIFILLCNLLGLIPSLQTPTAHIQVTLGCAVAAFIHYNYHGVREHGVLGYLRHLCGPMLALAALMLPIEIISNLSRLLSLSVRLYANMIVGEQLDKVLSHLAPLVVPVCFDALHIFVSVLQAYIFMLLPAIYISLAVSKEH